MKTGILN